MNVCPELPLQPEITYQMVHCNRSFHKAQPEGYTIPMERDIVPITRALLLTIGQKIAYKLLMSTEASVIPDNNKRKEIRDTIGSQIQCLGTPQHTELRTEHPS